MSTEIDFCATGEMRSILVEHGFTIMDTATFTIFGPGFIHEHEVAVRLPDCISDDKRSECDTYADTDNENAMLVFLNRNRQNHTEIVEGVRPSLMKAFPRQIPALAAVGV